MARHSSAIFAFCSSLQPEAMRDTGPAWPAASAAYQNAIPCQCWYALQSVLKTTWTAADGGGGGRGGSGGTEDDEARDEVEDEDED